MYNDFGAFERLLDGPPLPGTCLGLDKFSNSSYTSLCSYQTAGKLALLTSVVRVCGWCDADQRWYVDEAAYAVYGG